MNDEQIRQARINRYGFAAALIALALFCAYWTAVTPIIAATPPLILTLVFAFAAYKVWPKS